VHNTGESLLRDVDFFFFIYVTQEIDEGANKENHSTANRPPHIMGSSVAAIHEEVESVDSIPQRA
jgi:hypothetical protein